MAVTDLVPALLAARLAEPSELLQACGSTPHAAHRAPHTERYTAPDSGVQYHDTVHVQPAALFVE